MTASFSPWPRTSERREFIQRSAAAAGALLFGGCVLSTPGCTAPPRVFRVRDGRLARVPLAEYPELAGPNGVVRVVTPRHRAVFLRAEDDGGFSAFSGVCTHQGCIVSPSAIGFRCPCHGSTYDRDGQNVTGPAHRPLARWNAQLEGGDVVMELP